jgi:hypothetical protein
MQSHREQSRDDRWVVDCQGSHRDASPRAVFPDQGLHAALTFPHARQRLAAIGLPINSANVSPLALMALTIRAPDTCVLPRIMWLIVYVPVSMALAKQGHEPNAS